jgi:hypothetical protein
MIQPFAPSARCTRSLKPLPVRRSSARTSAPRLLGHEQQVRQRRPVAAGLFRQSHRGRTHVGQLPPQLLVVTQRLGGAHALRRALVPEEIGEGVAYRLLVAAQRVIGVPQLELVHQKTAHGCSKVNKVSISQHPLVNLVLPRGLVSRDESGCPAAQSHATP